MTQPNKNTAGRFSQASLTCLLETTQMGEPVIQCSGFRTEPVDTLECCSQAVEILPSPLLVLEEEKKRFQLRVGRLMLEPIFPSSPAPFISSGWTSGENAEPEDELCLVPSPLPHCLCRGGRK